MEALFYNHTVQDAEQRRADLRQAMHAFLADPTSRAAVQLIGLFVRIPTPSTITATRTTAKTSLSSSDALQPSVTASSTPRRQSNAQKLAWCALETDRRLRQAAEDAAALNRGIVHDMAADDDGVRQHRSKSGSNSKANPPRPLPPLRAATVVVVVVAYLAPQAREDLTVYESWQRCAEPCAPTESTTAQISRTTRRLSPLRRASFLALSLGAAPLLLSWSERPTHCYLGRLLLPHQTLLFDLSWCVTASLTSGVEVRNQGQGAGAGGSRVTLQVLLDLFTQDVLPCVHFPKGESRSAFWLAYSSLMASLYPRVFRAEDGDLALAASAPSPLYDSREGEHARPNAEAFGKTYRLLRQVFAALFHGHGGSAAGTAVVPGRTQATRVVLSYGGPLSALKRQLIHVGSRNAADGATPRAVEAALLRTRSLVDVYALFGVLAGQDRSDFYAAAAGFVRTATRRASTAAAGSISATDDARQAVESALVRVQTGGNASATPTADASPNAFVEIGARALARRRLKLERQRLGKLRPPLRPRERLARARKHKAAVAKRQAAAKKSTADTTKAKPVAGEKRPAEEAEEKDGAPGKGSAAPAKRKRRTEITVLPAAVQPSSAKESLSWSVDVG